MWREIYRWNGSKIVGPALYESAIQQTTNVFTTYTFTPNIRLVADKQYLALVTNQPDGVSLGGSGFGIMESSSYMLTGPDNGFLYYLPGYSDIWYDTPGLNAAFQADFAARVHNPLPAALPLFATGLGGLGLLGWRRKRKARAI